MRFLHGELEQQRMQATEELRQEALSETKKISARLYPHSNYWVGVESVWEHAGQVQLFQPGFWARLQC